MNKKEYLSKLANFLIQTNTTMNAESLADHLNWNGYKTNYETEYKGKRGTYKLIHSAYDYYAERGMLVEANEIAKAFKKPNGEYAY